MANMILLPTDSSMPALAATIEAVRLAKERGATLVILHVVETAPTMEVEDTAGNVALKRCPDIDGVVFARELAKGEGVKTEEIIKEGPVTGEIVNVADEMNVDVIIMGASAPHGVGHLYLGDVARAVVKRTKREVIVINPTQDQGRIAVAQARKIAPREKVKTVKSITSTKQFKVGIALFTIYTVFYAAFVTLGSYERGFMGERVLGLNVGLWLGIVVILMAIVMAIWFNWYAVKMEAKQGA